MKYDRAQQPVFRKIRRISKPGLRVYKNYKEIKPVMNGQGIFCCLYFLKEYFQIMNVEKRR